ncbi:MAG TPA: hypothetical protein VHR66_01105 [Gemmataceae bacterium]|jgi:hypothetical protein|nr:hypothetical protein [Gemmataceae bacterium]
MLRIITFVGIFGVFMGGMMVWFGFKEKDIASASTQAPETITLKNLLARGIDGNANIVLTEFVPCDNYVYESKGSVWKSAFVPVVPKDQADPGGHGGSPSAVKAIIFSTKARNENDLYSRVSQQQLAGLIVNKIRPLESKEKKLLLDSYPQSDFSTCVIIQEGREPASEEKTALMIYGGIAGIVIGLGAFGLALFVWRRQAAEQVRRAKRSKGPLRGDADDDDDEPAPRKRRIAADDDDDDASPHKKRPVARDDDEDDRPRRRPSRDDHDEDRPRRRPRRDD